MTKFSHRNELIRKRRRKKAIKKSIFLFILLMGILITLCLKLPYFNVTEITVLDNNNITKQEIVKLSRINKGTNIFYQNFNKSENNILSNPYIISASFKRQLPNKIQITVKERKAKFYIQADSNFAIIDKDAIVLEKRDNITNMNLAKLEGIDIANTNIGKAIGKSDDKKVKLLKTLSDLIDRSNEDVPKMTGIDLTDIKNFKVSYGNMVIILGNNYDIENKLNKAINILLADNNKTAKGYIDVSFNGNPVVSIQR